MEEILDMLLESIKQRSGVPDLAKELQDHARNFFYPNDDHNIHTTRSCIFNSAQAFYKNAQHTKSLLRRNLVIEFAREEGVDAGALRCEFFL